MPSSILALGLTPAWMLVIPHLLPFDEAADDMIPMSELAINIAAVVIPSIVGSFLCWIAEQYWKTKGKIIDAVF